MNPLAPSAPPPTASASQFSPSSSPLHPPSLQHNARVLSSLSTLAACFSGLIAGILGLTNFSGFLLYLLTSLLSALSIASLKCGFDVSKYVPQAHGTGAGGQGTTVSAAGEVRGWKGWVGLLGLGQENLLGFLLFWIGSYALIHVYD
ncbi:hypothetical protein EHS25_007757 [Saitozyma podzolica]|uniref:ER membrane protein complex subunit 6 n=1 Tax=Saitozyma podzolica TaxID=1890683 RepID=A0A427YQM9_9TREE|nr:hypothetical protein EHS25_007757 [Saitozyma podzolica]